MSLCGKIDMGATTLLEFSGPDTIRFLNGQLTQDVRKVVGTGLCLPSCVTDAKGKLQFRVWICEASAGSIWISSQGDIADKLEARLTRYLIADDVDVKDRSAEFQLVHLIHAELPLIDNARVAECNRFGISGKDGWLPSTRSHAAFDAIESIPFDLLEAFRIAEKVPIWGNELQPGMLPPEAGLDATDISYNKGCYIGQEVISRIKSAGKVNRSLQQFTVVDSVSANRAPIFQGDREVGEITSISPVLQNGERQALGYLKRSAGEGELLMRGEDGNFLPVSLL